MSRLKEGRDPEINDFGEDLQGKTWVESSDFAIEFWLDYNGFWEPENAKVDADQVTFHQLSKNFEEMVQGLAGVQPRIFFDAASKELIGVTRFRLIGTLSCCWHHDDPLSAQYIFRRSDFKILERARFTAIG